MTKKFARHVHEERIVDTKNYRYIAKEVYALNNIFLEIRRLPSELLETTAEWELVLTKRID